MHSLRGKITPSEARSDPTVRPDGIRVGEGRNQKPEGKVILYGSGKPEEDGKAEPGSLKLEPVEITAGPRLEPSGANILVIDDDPDIRAFLKLRLKEIGHRVLLAGDGEQGVAIAEREEPDLIILDILMPGMNGYDVARKLAGKPHTADIPVLILSARGSSREITQGLIGYADEYVTKPFQIDELLARVGALIRRTYRPTRDKREQRWVVQLLADKALNKSHQIFSRNIEGGKEFPASWKGPTPDLLTKWGNGYQAYLVETVESLQDEKTISRWKAIEEKKNVRLFIVGLSRETARLAKKIKNERKFQAKIMWSRPRSPGDSRWKGQNPFARRLMYVAAVVVLLASLFVSRVVPNLIDRISGINSGLNRQLSIYQPRDSERSLKTIQEKERQLKEEKRRVLGRP
jgi:CheY-like chemotaxis protein